MQISLIKKTLLLLGLMACQAGFAQSSDAFKQIDFTSLDAFNDPPANWSIAGDAVADFSKTHDLKATKGTGVAVDDFSKNNRMHLYTKEEFGDLELELYFMMAKGSNSGVYLQGRYEIQLLDSWTRLNTGSSDVGAVYSRWNPERLNFEGTPPAMNVGRAPGLWQHLQIIFRAPKFDAGGKKIQDARFEKVYLNGALVQQSVNVTGPTASSVFGDEKARGPLVLQGDHGPVAFKNIRYRELPPLQEKQLIPNDTTYWENRNPVLVNPTGTKNYLLRSFVNFEDKVITHALSVGSPAETNFSYDLQTGALFQIWRGKFLDVTRMWVGRGEPQTAIPLGAVIKLGNAPAVAVLPTEATPWPETIAFDSVRHHGYLLTKQKNPVFTYTINGTGVRDSLVCESNGEGISRTITVASPPANLYCRIITGKNIARLTDDLYAVDDKTFYIRLGKKYKPLIRPFAGGAEMIVRFDAVNPLTYAIVW